MKLVKHQVNYLANNAAWEEIQNITLPQFRHQIQMDITSHLLAEPRFHTWDYIQDKLWWRI